MKNKYLVIGALVLVAGGLFYLTKMGKNTPTPSSSGSPAASAAQNSPMSLRDLFKSGISETCTFSSGDSASSSSGTISVASGKMRGDINTTVDGKANTIHMIVLDSTMYYWMGDQKSGFKLAFSPTDASGSPTPAGSSKQSVDVDTKSDYRCTPGIVDVSKFALPAGVTFADMSSFAAPAPSTSAGSSSAACAACSNLTGAEKTQCMTYLKCE